MELLLIRHAEPVRIEQSDGPADPPLAEPGWEQARRLGRWLAEEHLDELWCSPLQRARQTAGPLAAATGVLARVEEGVAEYDRDSSSYVPLEELRAAKDERWRSIITGGYFGPDVDGGEFTSRVVHSIERLIAANAGRRVAVVCHGGVINVYLAHILGLADPIFFEPRYASISRVKASGSGPRTIVSLNEFAHLRGLPGF